MIKLTALTGFILLAVSSAWAQTPAPTPPAGDATATGGIMDYWWVIVLVVLAIVVIWYFMRGRRSV